MPIFKKKPKEDPVKVKESEQKKVVETHRKGGNIIASELELASVYDETGTISQEKLNQYKDVIDYLQNKLCNAKISIMDTSVIDIKLKRFVQRFNSAVKNGKEKTADVCLSALLYGVDTARVEIEGKTEAEMEPIMKVREEKIGIYETLFGFQEQIDQGYEQLKPIEREIKKASEEYQNQMQIVSDYCDEHMEEYDQLKTLFAMNPNSPVPTNLLHLDGLQTKAITYDNNIQLRLLLREFEVLRMARIEGLISNCKVALQKPENNDLTKLKEQAAQIQTGLNDHLKSQMQDMQELKELSERFADMVDSILSSAELKMEMTETNKRYEKLKKKMELEKKQKEENEKRKQEKLQQEQEQEVEEQENEQMYITN